MELYQYKNYVLIQRKPNHKNIKSNTARLFNIAN